MTASSSVSSMKVSNKKRHTRTTSCQFCEKSMRKKSMNRHLLKIHGIKEHKLDLVKDIIKKKVKNEPLETEQIISEESSNISEIAAPLPSVDVRHRKDDEHDLGEQFENIAQKELPNEENQIRNVSNETSLERLEEGIIKEIDQISTLTVQVTPTNNRKKEATSKEVETNSDFDKLISAISSVARESKPLIIKNDHKKRKRESSQSKIDAIKT